uniref:DSBA family thioredoxin domain containing protein n=1 Tax=Coptotermes formosanus TaxID=36987 RepID=R4V3Q7_COPFO|nr:DSBA family thioredoxin domain containing protein [Coptotermes formosanus]
MTTKVQIVCTSDIACPWCYLGKAFLQVAMEEVLKKGRIQFDLKFRSYMIDPETKKDGEEYLAYNQRRWGSDGWTYDLRRHAKSVPGVSFGNWKIWPNTLNPHRALRFARETSGSEAEVKLCGEFMKMCYEEGKNISLGETCVEAVKRVAGLDPEKAKEIFVSNKYLKEVIEEDTAGKRKGIHGVPYFEVSFEGSSKPYVVEGCQQPGKWIQMFERISS